MNSFPCKKDYLRYMCFFLMTSMFLHGEFHKFIQLIDANSLQCGTPSATRMSQTQFEVELAILWQQWTAKIIFSYLQRCRKARYGAFRARGQ